MTARIIASSTVSKLRLRRNEETVFEETAANLPDFLLAAYRSIAVNYPKFFKMDNLSKLGWLAAEMLMQGIDREGISPENIGIVLANQHASLDTDRKYYQTALDIASPALFVYTLPNIVAGEICIRHNIKGETSFFIAEAFDATFLQQYVYNLLNNDTLQACICGWIDVMDEKHKAVLALVTKTSLNAHDGPAIPFTADNLNKIYQEADGEINV